MSKLAIHVVTGVTSGLGHALFAQLAADGGPVIAVSRPGAKTRAVIEEVAAKTGNPSLHLLEADLSLRADVRTAAKEIGRLCDRLGGSLGKLVLNAATLTPKPELTLEGVDRMLAVNHLGAADLVLGLEDRIKASPEAQVCLVSSDAHRWVDESALAALEAGYDGRALPQLKYYGATKLAGLVFFHRLAQQWPEVKITAHHPGFVATNLGTHGSLFLRLWWRLSRWRMRDAAEAARELLAVVSSLPSATGQFRYWEQSELRDLPPACANAELTESVWRFTAGAL
jgi:retinol dehydrogenase-14